MSSPTKSPHSRSKKSFQFSLSPQSSRQSEKSRTTRVGNNIGTPYSSANNSPKIDRLRSVTNYHRLNFEDKIIHIDKKLQNFNDLQIASTIKKIDVQHNLITNFEGLPSLQALEELNCSYNNIHNLYKFPSLPKLKKIELSNNPFSDTEFYRLSLILICPSLRTIDNEIVTSCEKRLVGEFNGQLVDLIRSGWILSYPPPTGTKIVEIKRKLIKQNRKMVQGPKKICQKPSDVKKQSDLNKKRLCEQEEEIKRLQDEIKTLDPNIEFSTTETIEEEINSVCLPDSIIESNHESIIESNHNSIVGSDHNSFDASNHDSFIESNHNSDIKSNHGSIAASNHDSTIKSNHDSDIKSNHGSIAASNHNSTVKSIHNSINQSNHGSIINSSHNSIAGSDHNSIAASNHDLIIESNHSSIIESNHGSIVKSSHNSIAGSDHNSIAASNHGSIIESNHDINLQNENNICVQEEEEAASKSESIQQSANADSQNEKSVLEEEEIPQDHIVLQNEEKESQQHDEEITQEEEEAKQEQIESENKETTQEEEQQNEDNIQEREIQLNIETAQEEEEPQNEENAQQEQDKSSTQNEEIVQEEEPQDEENVQKEEIPHEQSSTQNEEETIKENEIQQNDETNDHDSQYHTDVSDVSFRSSRSTQQTVTCASCEKPIDINDCAFYSGHPYHKSCIKCMVCQKTFESSENLNDFINITPGLFLCHQHYQEYTNGDEIPADTVQELHDQKKKNFIDELFNPPIFTDEDIHDHPPEDILITDELANETVQLNKPYEDFIPTITFHFDCDPEKFDYEGFIQLLNETTEDESVIINVERGSVIIQVAVLAFKDFRDKLKNKFTKTIKCFKEKFSTPLGKSVVGNLVDEPEISIPNNEAIKESYNKPSMNLLQNTDDLSEIEIEEIKKEVFENLRKEKVHTNWTFIFSHEDLFKEAEEQVRRDIRNNQFEMIIVGQTIIANKYLNEYEKIKNKIPLENITERFLYHGSRLNNHQKIVKKHFLMPGQDKLKHKTDNGYYGKGIYATENLFYASMYANGFKLLGYNKKTYIICCRALYNNSMVNNINDLSCNGKKIDKKIVENYGINHSLVGSLNEFQPISDSEKENSYIYGEEFVFPNKYQLVPICSFTIMRKDHYILWKDENIDNSENSDYLRNLSKKMEVNIYSKKTVDEALEIVRIKKHAKIKLITNGGSDLSGKKLIEESRKITKSNFVCLVFASSSGHIEWVSKMENVLFTTNEEDFRKFAQIKMNRKSILNFAEELSNKYNYQFKINKSELLNFPYLENSEKYLKNLME